MAQIYRGGFNSYCTFLNNNYNEAWGSWSGFAYSRVNDTTTQGYGNQYAVISGTDVSSNGTYVVGYGSWDTIITLPYSAYVHGFYINNTTYAALDMLNGSSFTKKFGGITGDDPDWYKITVIGKDKNGVTVGSVDFMLADYTSTNNANDYIVTDWTWLDLSALGPNVSSLHFSLSSSDNGSWGMNTPAYFAIDELSIVPSFSSATNDNNSFDTGIPGFVGKGGDGVPESSASENYVNPVFACWATAVTNYFPTEGVSSNFTNYSKALYQVTGDNFDIVSLGDLDQGQISSNIQPGEITLAFDYVISDQDGADFAVFENGITEGTLAKLFAELAYVEVSSDGTNFARFPSISMNTNSVGTYEGLDVRNIYNLAGKHANNSSGSWGTPFDLSMLKCNPLVQSNIVDLSDIKYVRIVDIPGSGDFLDSELNPIYDPWLTSGSGGFDLEAVGVINSPQFSHITVISGSHGLITPYGVPDGKVAIAVGSNMTFNI